MYQKEFDTSTSTKDKFYNADVTKGGPALLNDVSLSNNGPKQQVVTSELTKNVGAEANLVVGNGGVSVGYHMYSYSLDFICLDPMGSTNYGKLTNVCVSCTPSDDAVRTGATTTSLHSGVDARRLPVYADAQKFSFVLTAVNNNIARISGGAFGFPVL